MIPFLDLKAQYRSIQDEVEPAVLKVLASSQYILGPEVEAFEQEFASFCGSRFSTAVNSGTSALHLALLSVGVGSGDEVITVPYTFVATVAAIRYTGAKPVFVDVEPDTYTMDVTRLEKAVTSRTKAIVPVHLYGHPADMDPIFEVAGKHGLKVIEDAAQAHGAEYKGRRCGSMGDLACFSFYPGKNLGAYGEGGAVTSQQAEYIKKVGLMRDWGQDGKYNHVMEGFNARMDGIQGAILRIKLARLEAWTEARRHHAEHYTKRLKDVDVVLPMEVEGNRHVYHLYTLQLDRRGELIEHLKKKEIATHIHYPIPIHLMPVYSDLGHKGGDFPVAEKLARKVVSLPLYPEMSDESVDIVSDEVADFLNGA